MQGLFQPSAQQAFTPLVIDVYRHTRLRLVQCKWMKMESDCFGGAQSRQPRRRVFAQDSRDRAVLYSGCFRVCGRDLRN